MCLVRAQVHCTVPLKISNYPLANVFLDPPLRYNPWQSGCIKGDSCVNQLLAITHEIHKSLDANPSINTICAFSGMPNLFTPMSNYLCNRQQRVVLNGITSSWKSIRPEAPEGSVLDPLRFPVFINDLLDELICNPKLWANKWKMILILLQPNPLKK